MKFTVAVLLCLAGTSLSEIFDQFDENRRFLADHDLVKVTNECIKQGKKCCPDGEIARNNDINNCAKKLCYDMSSGTCKKAKKAGELSKGACKYNLKLKHCYFSCNTCDENSRDKPKGKCERENPLMKCCWDGNVADSNGSCPPCVDTNKITCARFLSDNDNTCKTSSYHKRKSFYKYCPVACGLCP